MAHPDQPLQIPNPESSNIILLDPQQLIRNNPASLIINHESYNRMRAHFAPDQMDHPHVVWVRTVTPEEGEMVTACIIDGMTRTKVIADFAQEGVTLPHAPHLSFREIAVRDVTASTLQNPLIVLPEERKPGQNALSPMQYLRAVLPPTIVHAEIAPDRVAAYIIRGWRDFVGDDVASRFSTLAALHLLSGKAFQNLTIEEIRSLIYSQREFFSGETPAQRQLLNTALLNLMELARHARLPIETTTESAFYLIASSSPIIGGERETWRQIHGLLHQPSVELKLSQALPQYGDREKARMEIGQIVQNLITTLKPDQRKVILATMTRILQDDHLTFEHVLDILTSQNPAQRYVEVREQINQKKIMDFMLALPNKKDFSPIEMQLIASAAHEASTYLDTPYLKRIAERVKEVDEACRVATAYKVQLERMREELINKGIRAALIDDAIEYLGRITIPSEDIKVRTMEGFAATIMFNIRSIQERIQKALQVRLAENTIHEVFSNRAVEITPEERDSIVRYVLSSSDKVLTESQLRLSVVELGSLSRDLRQRVTTGDITLRYALRLQRERYATPTRPKIIPPLHQALAVPVEPAPLPPLPELSETTEPPKLHTPQGPDSATDRTQEIVKGNEILREQISRWIEESGNIQLSSRQDLDGETIKTIDVLLQRLGKLRFNHPDIRRVIEDDYPRLQDTLKVLRAEAIARQEDEAQRDTRTRR